MGMGTTGDRRSVRPGRARRGYGRGLALALVAAASVVGNADLREPPRYDGAGYAVLAKALATGEGYRAIDHPEAPRHAHFPPGYPLLLAGLWRATGSTGSVVVAHGLSAACTVGAVLLAWAWLRRVERRRAAFLIALVLAVNWTWGRVGGSIRSEPLFLLLTMTTLVAAGWAGRRGGVGRGLVVGGLIGMCVLTRQVGVGLGAAILIDLVLRRRRTTAVAAMVSAAGLLGPWIAWQVGAGEGSQAALVPISGLIDSMAENAVFYLRRMPDQVVGPVVEVATVFRPEWSAQATWAACLASGVVLGGWLALLGRPRTRLAGLVPLLTLPLLLAWPFTEAGRFLVPLLPFTLLGAVEGLVTPLRWAGARRPRRLAALLILVASLPYPAYALASRRAAAERRTHADFDAACAFLNVGTRRSTVLSRHPGEVFWQTGRPGLSPDSADPAAIDRLIARYGVGWLLVDDDRFARAPASPLGRHAKARGLTPAWTAPGGTVQLYRAPEDRPPSGENPGTL